MSSTAQTLKEYGVSRVSRKRDKACTYEFLTIVTEV